MNIFLESDMMKQEASELADEVLGHLETLSEGAMRDEYVHLEIRPEIIKRIARVVRATFEHELNNLRLSDLHKSR
jgi:hypothetical protein